MGMELYDYVNIMKQLPVFLKMRISESRDIYL